MSAVTVGSDGAGIIDAVGNGVDEPLLVAGIVASLSGFIARETMHPHELEENAVKIEGVEEEGADL